MNTLKILSRPLSILIFSLSGAIAIPACTRTVEKPNTFHGVLRDDIKTLDPGNAYDTVSLEVAPLIYESLYQYDYLSDVYQVIPLLAAAMPQFSADRLTLTIPIKKGVLFQDDSAFKSTKGKGRELKAQDFVFAFKRLADPRIQSQGWWIFDGKLKGINAFHDKLMKATPADHEKIFSETVEGVRALDDHTIQLKLTQPYPQILYVLTMAFTAPVAFEAVDAYGDEKGNIRDHPVGTGPYVLTDWSRGQKVILDRNPTHHQEFYPGTGSPDSGRALPFSDRLAFQIIKEQQPAWLGFMKGDFDLTGIPKDNFTSAVTKEGELTTELKAKNISLNVEAAVSFYYISFNNKDPLLKNKSLRQALSAAIDRSAWIALFTNNRGKKMVTALPEGIPDRPLNSVVKYDHDLEISKALLKKAGYPEGKGLPVLNFDLRGADTVNRQLGEFFVHQFSKIGVKLNVVHNTFPAYLEKAKQGNLQISYGGWSMDYPDAENVYQLLYGPNSAPGPNESNFNHPVMNQLYQKMAVMQSGPERAEIIGKMDAILQEECPWALGYYHADYKLTQPWLLNFRGKEIILNKAKYFRVDPTIKNQNRK